MRVFEKMASGEPYDINDPELVEIRYTTRDKVDQFNQLNARQVKEKRLLIQSIFKQVGEQVHIEKGLRVDYGLNTSIGHNVFINYNLVLLDCAPVIIGNNVFIAPNVQIYTAEHPLDPTERRNHKGSARPIVVGDDVWIGGGVILLPGITIGKGTTIGAGSIVTKSIPANVIACGNPCRTIRSIT